MKTIQNTVIYRLIDKITNRGLRKLNFTFEKLKVSIMEGYMNMTVDIRNQSGKDICFSFDWQYDLVLRKVYSDNTAWAEKQWKLIVYSFQMLYDHITTGLKVIDDTDKKEAV